MSITPEALDAMAAAGLTAEQIIAVVKADIIADAARKEAELASKREATAARVRKHRAAKRAVTAGNDGNALQTLQGEEIAVQDARMRSGAPEGAHAEEITSNLPEDTQTKQKPSVFAKQRVLSDASRKVGEEAAEIISGLRRVPDHAGSLQNVAEAALKDAGFHVIRELGVANRGDGKSGRIDLAAKRDGGFVVIELDCRSIRTKSVEKLRSVNNAYRIIGLRGDIENVEIDGIDRVIGVGTLLEGQGKGRKHPLPADFALTEARAKYPLQKGWSIARVHAEFERFCNHFWKTGTAYKDWDAAWRNWVTSPHQQHESAPRRRSGNSYFDFAREETEKLNDFDFGSDAIGRPLLLAGARH